MASTGASKASAIRHITTITTTGWHLKCSFCGCEIVPGTGRMYVQKDATLQYFCSGKCEKNSVNLKRRKRNVFWTESHREEKVARRAMESGHGGTASGEKKPGSKTGKRRGKK